MPGARAAIDLGSNSALLLVRDADGVVLCERSAVVGLGRGLGDGGRLDPHRVEAALATLADYADQAARHGVAPDAARVQATSALRRASDADGFLARALAVAGLRIEVISGPQEARRNRLGALSDRSLLPTAARRVAVVDIGGGSTEISVDDEGRDGPGASLEIGTVRLVDEALPDHAPWDDAATHRMTGRIAHALASLPALGRLDAVVAIAGTATTLATRDLGLSTWQPSRVHGHRLTRAALASLRDRWQGSTAAQRAADLPADPDRAGPVPAGILILDGILEHLGADHALVSVRDARWWLTGPGGELGPDGSRE